MFGNHIKPKIVFLIIFVISLFTVRSAGISELSTVLATDPEPYYQPIERFGITAPYDYSVEDLELFNIRSVLDWKVDNTVILPETIEYIHVLRVSDSLFLNTYNSLSTIVPNNPGEVWIIGNEPDRFCFQDSVNPEVYAERYYQMAIAIRSLDPTAKLGFGTVVQPTPIRIRYLERAINKLIELSEGNREEAMGLIDIWSIHSFILNEEPYEWGADIPVGFFTYNEQKLISRGLGYCYTGEVYEENIDDAQLITNYSDAYSIDKFAERIINFRHWMNSIGEREKPLWVTEYGTLFPSWEIVCANDVRLDCESPFNGWPTEIDNKNYMIKTFNFLMYARDIDIGLSWDEHNLVQRWYWYSLNDYTDNFGGSLLDPDNNYELTLIGEEFKLYTDYLISPKTYFPLIFK